MNKQMSVSKRLGLGFLVILALMVAVAVVSALKVELESQVRGVSA